MKGNLENRTNSFSRVFRYRKEIYGSTIAGYLFYMGVKDLSKALNSKDLSTIVKTSTKPTNIGHFDASKYIAARDFGYGGAELILSLLVGAITYNLYKKKSRK